MRTIVDIPRLQIEVLDRFCTREGISRAEAVRRALSHYLETVRPSAAEKPAFGLWKGRAVDGLKYERAVRREWDRV